MPPQPESVGEWLRYARSDLTGMGEAAALTTELRGDNVL